MTACLHARSGPGGWASHGILVNAVSPTFIETELSKKFLGDPQFREYALPKNLLKRIDTPEDVVGAVIYLASPASSLVTDHILMVEWIQDGEKKSPPRGPGSKEASKLSFRRFYFDLNGQEHVEGQYSSLGSVRQDGRNVLPHRKAGPVPRLD